MTKKYTTAGRDGYDKYQLCRQTPPYILVQILKIGLRSTLQQPKNLQLRWRQWETIIASKRLAHFPFKRHFFYQIFNINISCKGCWGRVHGGWACLWGKGFDGRGERRDPWTGFIKYRKKFSNLPLSRQLLLALKPLAEYLARTWTKRLQSLWLRFQDERNQFV